MIITPTIKKIALQIRQDKKLPTDEQVVKLISEIKKQLKRGALNPRSTKSLTNSNSEKYPLDREGYAVAFDPFVEERLLIDTWNKFGVVVVKQVISPEQCDQVINRMHQLVMQLSDNACDLNKRETWTTIPHDETGTPFISRGFFELYHDEVLAQIRQSVTHYLAQVLIWQRHDIWTSFDRLGIKLPGHAESKALSLHVDQNPKIHPGFKTVQGVLALEDCPVERGTFVAVIGSRNHFSSYENHALDKGEYVELPTSCAGAPWVDHHLQAFPLRKGDLVLWDSRTTHANTENISEDVRYVAYTAAGPAREDDMSLVDARREAYTSGIGSNNREALMHASKKPRYSNPLQLQQLRQPEKLSLLGKLMYGLESYETTIT